jgi:hypothetical protein
MAIAKVARLHCNGKVELDKTNSDRQRSFSETTAVVSPSFSIAPAREWGCATDRPTLSYRIFVLKLNKGPPVW